VNNKDPKKKNYLKRKLILIGIDLLIVLFSFTIFIWIKPASVRIYIPRFANPFLFFSIVWIIVSVIITKYSFHKAKKSNDIGITILISNITILAIVTTLIYYFNAFHYSRLVVFGTIILATILELALAYFYYYYKHPVLVPDFKAPKPKKPKFYPVDKTFKHDKKEELKYIETREQIKNIIIEESSENVYNFISRYIDVGNPKNLVLSTTTQFNIDQLPHNRFDCLVNLHRINDFRRINKFFESINNKLSYGGIYINSAETFQLRKSRILEKYPPVINHIYYFFDFLFTRVFPKMAVFKNIYFYITRGTNRVISKAETLGRIYSCGFECIDESYIDGKLYFVVRKVKEPAYDLNPSYGPLFRMKRIGKNNKIIYVYKVRTMHPYAEYIQEYIYNAHGSADGDKANNDYRITLWGRFFRKFWIDELPMLINLFKGDLKLVGVRPLSIHKFNTYDKALQEKRVRYKPGLVPPFYADIPKNFDDLMRSEEKYLDAFAKNPVATDVRYFFKAFYNIFFKRARSN